MLEKRAAVSPKTWDPGDGELNRQNIALLTAGLIARCAGDRADDAVGKYGGIKVCGVNGVTFVPQADCVLIGHFMTPEEVSWRLVQNQ